MVNTRQKKGPNHRFVESWSMGMNDYEIAKELGVNLDTIRSVKKDLCQMNNPAPNHQVLHNGDQNPRST